MPKGAVMPTDKRKPGRGGARPGAGRPVSTRSSTTKPVVFRVTAEQRAELYAEALALGLGSADLAAKRRAFPG